VRLFTDFNSSDTDNIVPFEYVFGGMLNLAQSINEPFENTTSVNLISLLCILLFCPVYFD